jgi:S1-C subfamily serine protease
MTFPAIVRITRPGGDGSGVFITDDLVITAGHVVQPPSGLFDPDDYQVVLPDGTKLEVKAVKCHQGWSSGSHPSSDMAVLRVTQKRPGLVATCRVDPQASKLAVVVGGSNAQQYRGTVTRVASAGSLDMFASSDLAFPGGVSGGPIVDGSGTVLGVATRSAPAPNAELLIGLPLLAETFGWLRDNCP